jgi:hypothetical protein
LPQLDAISIQIIKSAEAAVFGVLRVWDQQLRRLRFDNGVEVVAPEIDHAGLMRGPVGIVL